MSVMTNVPPVTFDPTVGFSAPSQQDILTGVQEDINAAFGGGLNQSLSTPQGQLASSFTAIIAQTNDTFVNLTNQTNPNFATGIWQDAIGQLYFLQRNPSEPTVVQALCVGGVGVVVNVGALAQDQSENIYVCTAGNAPDGFPSNGQSTLTFANQIPGPTPCPAGTLTTIYQGIPGWDTITNPTDGVLGNDTETASEFEERRVQSVAANSIGSLPSVLGAVLSVPGTLDAFVTENPSASPTTIGGFTLAANSLYVACVGSFDQIAMATAIWSKKAPGCAYNGNTTVTIQDTRSGYSPPFPSYNVSFEIPPALPILFAVNIANNATVPSNAATLIQNAIIGAFAGTDGGTRARIGSTIYASRFYAPIAALGPWAQIILLQIGSGNTPVATFTGAIAGTTLTVSGVTGTIAIGQTIGDANNNVLPGTTIISGSGTSWQVSITHTVSSEAMTASLANQNSVAVNIDQVPTIDANNIAVTTT
jgi:hypothetical protein